MDVLREILHPAVEEARRLPGGEPLGLDPDSPLFGEGGLDSMGLVRFVVMVEERLEERTGLEENFYRVLGMDVAHIEIYVRPGRDIARLVEVAALTHALKLMGHDPAKDFNDRLIAFMRDQARQPPPTRIKPVVRPRA